MELDFEDLSYQKSYNNFERVVLEEFIPLIVKLDRRRNKITRKIEIVPIIFLEDIINLGLSENENKMLIDYLQKNKILVINGSSNQEVDLENINRLRSYKNSKLPKMLTRDKIKEKFRLLKQTNDLNIREEIIVSNMRLVSYFAWRSAQKYRMDLRELEQYGYEGLIYAVDHFNLESGVAFSSYAGLCIKGFIKNGIRELLGLTMNKNWSVNMMKAKQEIERQKGVSLETDKFLINDIINLMIERGQASEVNRQVYEQHLNLLFNNDSLEDLLVSGEDILMNNRAYVKDYGRRKAIARVLETLNEKEQKIIKLRFGFDDGMLHTLAEIGQILNLSRERVRQIERKALLKLKSSSNYAILFAFWDEDIEEENSDYYIDEHHTTKK